MRCDACLQRSKSIRLVGRPGPHVEWKWRNLYRPASSRVIGFLRPVAPAPVSPVGAAPRAPEPPARGAGAAVSVVASACGRS